MTQDTPAFFTLDKGTASTAAALVAPVSGRYRLLAAGSAPASIEPDILLEDLAWRVARTDATIAGSLDGWQRWSRLEVSTPTPATATLVAADAATGRDLERAFVGAGWRIHARLYGPNPDIIELGEACLHPRVDAVVVGSPDEAREEDREELRLLWPRCGSIVRMRDDLALVASGTFDDRPEGIPDGRLFALPAPAPVAATTETTLREAARQVADHLRPSGRVQGADGHEAGRRSVASLAALLDARVEGIHIGAVAGARTFASGEREHRHAVFATAALLPDEIRLDGPMLDTILRWSAAQDDPDVIADHLRDLQARGWAGHDASLVGLRLAALRSALERLEAAWDPPRAQALTDAEASGPEIIVVSGTAFSGLPAPAMVLAVADTIRRPGAFSILHDHARLLRPLGALPVEDDRRRLIGDLMDDLLVPLGSAVLTGAAASEAASGSLEIATSLGDQRLRLEPGQVRYVDLPPGIDGRLSIDGSAVGLNAARGGGAVVVRGGLGGLLVDTRPIPLELPTAGEPRRSLLAGWEAPALAGVRR